MISLQKEIRKELWNEIIEISNKAKNMREDSSDDNPGGVVILENSPVGESQSNGIVEGAVRRIQGQVRTLKLSTQSRYKQELPGNHDAITWMIRHASELITRYQVGADGKQN